MRRTALLGTVLAAVLALGACSENSGPTTTAVPRSPAGPATGSHTDGPAAAPAPAGGRPHPAHIVVVVEENRAYSDIIGNPAAPYLNALARSGASFTHYVAVRHPSQPNYVALFSGSTHGLTDDSCPHTFAGPNLATQLIAAHRGFRGYSESLPHASYAGCTSNDRYARKHTPWVDFPAVPARANQPFSAFPSEYAKLPAVSFVIPNLDHDMHDGTIAAGDRWLRANLGGYARWARTHDSLLIVTWDEDDGSHGNRIPTIVAGAHVRPGRYGEPMTPYRLLRTLEALEGLGPIGQARPVRPVADIWTG